MRCTRAATRRSPSSPKDRMSSPSSADGAPSPLASPASLAIHLDAIGGVAGDMFVAAIVDALPDLAAPILRELACVRPRGAPVPVFSATSTGGLRACRFGTEASTVVAAKGGRLAPVRASRRPH